MSNEGGIGALAPDACRIRYSWNRPEAMQAVASLTEALHGQRRTVTRCASIRPE